MTNLPVEIAQIGDDIHFDAEHYWVSGEFVPEALTAVLTQQTSLVNYHDGTGNRQSSVRLDVDPGGRPGFWVTVPVGTGKAPIDAAVAAYPAALTKWQADNAPRPADPVVSVAALTRAINSLPDAGQLTKADLEAALATVAGPAPAPVK